MNPSLREILLRENLMLSNNPCGTDKGDFKSYVEKFYEDAFHEFQDTDIKLLEIGFRHGASLALWSSFFAKGVIVGIDNLSDEWLQQSPPNLEWITRKNVRTISADAYDFEVAADLQMEFDVIIDDGPHTLWSQKKALELYLPKLKRNGIFIIEDIQSRGRLALLSFSKLVPWTCKVRILDFRKDDKGDDNVLFVIHRTSRCQILNRVASYLGACCSVFYEVWFHTNRRLRKRLLSKPSRSD